MSQRYLDPHTVVVPAGSARPSKRVYDALLRDGQIVPLLVVRNEWDQWQAADHWQGERLIALRDLNWETVLTEDEWHPDDL